MAGTARQHQRTDVEKARGLAKEFYALCQDDEVCAAVANMIWHDENPEDFAGNDAEQTITDAGRDTPCQLQGAFRLPNIRGILKQDEDEVKWGEVDQRDILT